MRILKVAVGNAHEAYVESRFRDGLNIISSDDNNKGKTIVIQSILYALGNEPTFPTSFNFKHYHYYLEFEINNRVLQICRSQDGFVLKNKSISIFDSVGELKRYWTKSIFKLPNIYKNNILYTVDPVLFFQLFFVGQDKKDTSNISHKGYYNKSDFYQMLYSMAGIGKEIKEKANNQLLQSRLLKLKEERESLLRQNKILKSLQPSISFLSSESDRLLFKQKISEVEEIRKEILNIRKKRNLALTKKSQWENTYDELTSLSRVVSHGVLKCMDCNSKNISFNIQEGGSKSYTFDITTKNIRSQILQAIANKIQSYKQEIDEFSWEISSLQQKLKKSIDSDEISLESILAYKKKLMPLNELDEKIREINSQILCLTDRLESDDLEFHLDEGKKRYLKAQILQKMNELNRTIDPSTNITFEDLFSTQYEIYSGSQSTIFHLVRLLAIQNVFEHNFPLIVDSFRAEDLSTVKENIILSILKGIPNQVILTTTLKQEEKGKYLNCEGITNIDYQEHQASKILEFKYVNEFKSLLAPLGIRLRGC